jgi:hypothetical protein
MFRPSLVIIRCFKTVLETAVLAFCASNILCVVPSHIRVFRRAGCFPLLHCVFKPRVAYTIPWLDILTSESADSSQIRSEPKQKRSDENGQKQTQYHPNISPYARSCVRLL